MIPEHIRRLLVHNTVFRRPQPHHIINRSLVDGIFFFGGLFQVCQEAQGILPRLLVQDREGVVEDRRGDGRRGDDNTGWRWAGVVAATMVVVREWTRIQGGGQILRRGG